MAEGFSPHSQTSSPPVGYKVEDENEDDQFRETELFEDTLVLNSPFTEMKVENLNTDTEIVEDTEPAEYMTTGTTCEYDQVVLDSEDEELNDRDVGKGFLEDKTSPTVKISSTLFQKRLHKPPYEQVDAYATTFGKSTSGNKGALVDVDSFDDNNHIYSPAMLSHIYSPEPMDSTKAALGFVDQFLSSNDVDLFEEVHCGKTTREKSLHLLSARGPLNLAMKIKARTQDEEKEPFKWVDSCQHDNRTGMFGEKIEASSNFGRYKQTYTRRRQRKSGNLQSQGNCSTSTSNRCDEKLGQGLRMATENNNSLKELDVQPSPLKENVNVYSSVTHLEDMPDIGLDTQIAAEAMNALAFVLPSGCEFNDTHQPENELDGSLSNLTKNEALLENSSYIQNPGLHSIKIKSNKNNASCSGFSKITFSISGQHTDNQEPNLASGKMKKSKSTAEGQFENNTSLQMHSKHVPLEEFCSLGEYICFQPAAREPKYWKNERRQPRIKDQPSHHTEANNNVKEKGIINHKRKRSHFVVDAMTLGVRTKCLKMPSNSCTVARKNRLNHLAQVSPQLSATSSILRADSWVYPKRSRGKRKGAKVGTNVDAPTVLCIDEKKTNVFSSSFSRTGSWVYPKRSRGKRKRANVGAILDALTVLDIDGNKNNVFSSRSLEDRTDVDKSCFPHSRLLCNASGIDDGTCFLHGNFVSPGSAGDAIKLGNLHDMHPLLLAHVEISSNKKIAQSRSEIAATVASSKCIEVSNANHTCTKHHKIPCEKTLPKTSVLKERNRLGVPELTSNMMWKDLRYRRDMTHVRVLFSQHLDASIIKQQRKILARLNISIASNSMEATHFIADKFKRTKNMLETMALGRLIVNHLWLESCGQANCFIDEKNYILRDMKKEKEIGFNMPVSLARARQKPLLKGKRVYITQHIKPDKEVIASLVTAVHGQVVDESEVCAHMNDNILDDLLILSSEDDYAICHPFLKKGSAVYSSELILNGIVIQKLELERHQLFNSQVQGNNLFGKVYSRR